MKKIVVLIALLLGGCGSQTVEPAPASVSQFKVTAEYVGILMNSQRRGARDYTVVTSHGVFATYNSLPVPASTPVYLDTITDTGSGLVMGNVLRALEKSILVKEILVLVRYAARGEV